MTVKLYQMKQSKVFQCKLSTLAGCKYNVPVPCKVFIELDGCKYNVSARGYLKAEAYSNEKDLTKLGVLVIFCSKKKKSCQDNQCSHSSS